MPHTPLATAPDEAAPRLITIGETMMMLTPEYAEPLSTARNLSLHPGGAESNVASHAAHLGVSSAWVSILGDDVLGHRIRRSVAEHGVDTRWVGWDPTAPTGVYFKDPGHGVLYYRRGSAASRMNADTLADIPLEDAAMVHLSGITPALSKSCADLVDAVFKRVSAGAASLSFDINYRPSLWPTVAAAPTLRALANRADIVFVGLDEAQSLWGCDTAQDVRKVLPDAERLIVKDSDVGATEFSAGSHTFEPAIPTEVIEAVGAGDAFAAGYLCSALRGDDTRERLRAGHERARLVLLSTSDFIADFVAPSATYADTTD